MTNELATRSNRMTGGAMEAWTVMREQAGILVKTGFLPEAIKTVEQALAVMMKGNELGIPPMYALSNIVIVKGKPTCAAELMLALIYRDHGDNAVVVQASSAQVCTIAYKRRQWASARQHSFTMDDARLAGLLTNATWQKYPAAMLRARCISAVARMAFPDSIAGMYTPEELGAEVLVLDGEQLAISAPPESNGAQPVVVNQDTGEIGGPPHQPNAELDASEILQQGREEPDSAWDAEASTAERLALAIAQARLVLVKSDYKAINESAQIMGLPAKATDCTTDEQRAAWAGLLEEAIQKAGHVVGAA